VTVVAQDAPAPAPAAGFLELPGEVYRDDPAAIPEEPAEVAAAFSPRNPWFGAGGARTFCVPGRVRAAAFHRPGVVIDGEPAAFFGYFETLGDADAERELFAAVAAWATARGARRLFGPINFATALGYRVLLEAEPGATPFPGEPWTPRHYGARLEALGFELHQRYLTQVVSPAEMRAARDDRRPILAGLCQAGFRFESLGPALWLERLRDLHALCDVIFGANFAYTPMGFETFAAHAGARFAARFCPRTSVICFAPDGGVAGLFLVFPDWGPLVRRGAGAARVPLGAIDAGAHFDALGAHPPVTAVLKTVGVAPRYQQQGVFAALLVWLLDRCEGTYDRYLGALIREDNASRRFFDPYATTKRWYGLYARRLDAPAGGTGS
jgi:GNAT superfamily N-acetyltransferase